MMTCVVFLFFLIPCVEADLCLNGGTFDGIKCICDDLHYGPKCEFLVQDTLDGSTTTSITTSALSEKISTSPTHPTDTRATPHPTTPNSTTNTAFTTSSVDILSPGLPGQTQDSTTTHRTVVSNRSTASASTTSSWSETKSPSSQGNTTVNNPTKNTPSTGTLAPSSCNSRFTVSSRPISGISSSYTTMTTSKTANTGTIISKSGITTTTSQLCHNGGIFDGTKCLCNDDLFYGPKCEFLIDVIQVPELSVNITVKAEVKVTNREYKESLEDLSSDYSQEIQAQFRKQMNNVYGAVPGYCDVEILRMRKGSIIVEHKVVSQILIENSEEMVLHILEVITEAVKDSLKDIHTEGECIEHSGPELCFASLPNLNFTSNFSFNDICKIIIDPKYADYYYPHIIEGTVHCVSRCFQGTQDSMNCFHGFCHVSEIGPHCICNNLDVFWYLDSYCQFPIQISVLALTLALAVLIVISIILVICLIKEKRKKPRNRRSDAADCGKMGQRNPVFPE